MSPSSLFYIKFTLIFTLLLNSCGYELRTYSNSLSNKSFEFDAKSSFLNLEMENQLNSKGYFDSSVNPKTKISIKVLDHVVERYVGSTGSGALTTQVRLDYKICLLYTSPSPRD